MYPVLFQIGSFEISTFGVMMAIAFLVGGELTARTLERFGHAREMAWNLLVWAAIGGVAGAKLWYVLEQLSRESGESLLSYFTLANCRGGLTWYGGLAGGAIATLIAGRAYGLRPLALCNMAAPTLAAGQAIGRIGCFLVGDDYGQASDLPWAVAFPQGLPPTVDEAGRLITVHPTMSYETLWLAAAAVWLWRRRGKSPFLFGEYLFLAGLGRLWIETFRLNPSLLGPFSNAQLVAIGCILAGGGVWLYLSARRARELKPETKP